MTFDGKETKSITFIIISSTLKVKYLSIDIRHYEFWYTISSFNETDITHWFDQEHQVVLLMQIMVVKLNKLSSKDFFTLITIIPIPRDHYVNWQGC
jgi:hypothetical protein